VVPGDVQPDGILRLTERHHVTVGFGNPDILESLIRSPLWPGADLSGVRFLITGGAPVPEPLIRAYLKRGLTLLQGYGLSEAAPVALLLRPGLRSARSARLGRHPCSSTPRSPGRPAPGQGQARRGNFWSAARTSWPGTGTSPGRPPGC
jgi:acyl-CoA synthetase (AMP-forming)/AMP-acid ligase II